MSGAPTELATATERLTKFPEFELHCLVDDEADPREVTIFAPSSTDISTHWITIDINNAVRLDDVR